MNERKKAYLLLHISVFLWGFTAILGKLISIREVPLVWYRILLTCGIMLFLPPLWKGMKTLKKENVATLFGIGFLVCLHWICFYGSIKFSNASVALCCLATTSLMTSIIEPIVNKTRIKKHEILLGLIIVPAIGMVVYYTKFYLTGIIMGLLAAFFAALFTTLNSRIVKKLNSVSMTFMELSGGFIFLSVFLPIYFHFFPEVNFIPSNNDWGYLLILAGACTVLPFIISLQALRHITAFASVLTVNLEPVYGILLAIPFFHENKELNPQFYIGTSVIIAVVFLHPFLQKKMEKKGAINN